MQSIKTIRLNIILKPNHIFSAYALKTSYTLAQLGKPLFILDGKNFHPHITLYSPEFPEESLPLVISEVGKIAKSTESFTLKFAGYDFDEGYIGQKFVETEVINRLHLKVVKTLNPLRQGVLRAKYLDQAYLNNLSANDRQLIGKYGYPRVLDQYVAHLTLIRIDAQDDIQKIAAQVPWKLKTTCINKMAIFTMGENGTCVKQIQEFDLR